jgi:hypothetical protein
MITFATHKELSEAAMNKWRVGFSEESLASLMTYPGVRDLVTKYIDAFIEGYKWSIDKHKPLEHYQEGFKKGMESISDRKYTNHVTCDNCGTTALFLDKVWIPKLEEPCLYCGHNG